MSYPGQDSKAALRTSFTFYTRSNEAPPQCIIDEIRDSVPDLKVVVTRVFDAQDPDSCPSPFEASQVRTSHFCECVVCSRLISLFDPVADDPNGSW